MSECGTCKEALPSDGDHTLCSDCKKGYHFDCCSLLESSWRSMGSRRSVWKCQLCRDAKEKNLKNKQDSSNSSGGGDQAIVMALAQMSAKMDKHFAEMEKKMNSKFGEFETTLNYYGDKVEEATKAVKSCEQKMVMMGKRLDKAEEENSELRTKLRNMERQLNEMGQKEFNTKIEISGIKNKDINQDEVIKKILQKDFLGCSDEIQFKAEKVVMQVGEDKHEKTSIVVQFQSRDVRNMVLSKIKEQKLYSKIGDILPNEGSLVFINEALCPYYKKLFYEANRVKRDKKYAYLWVKDGKIFVKKTEQSNTLRLDCMDDLGKL